MPAPLLQVFTRAPVAGRVKTRLAGEIGTAAAVALHVELTERTLRVAAAARAAGYVSAVELWVDTGSTHPVSVRWARECGAAIRRQNGGDIGERMAHALSVALTSGPAAILVGSDCPGIVPGHLAAASAALNAHDAVFAPAEDGGYVLVGVRSTVPCFADIPWGTRSVMAATRAALAAAGATWHELETLWDVDTAVDYARWRASRLARASENLTGERIRSSAADASD